MCKSVPVDSHNIFADGGIASEMYAWLDHGFQNLKLRYREYSLHNADRGNRWNIGWCWFWCLVFQNEHCRKQREMEINTPANFPQSKCVRSIVPNYFCIEVYMINHVSPLPWVFTYFQQTNLLNIDSKSLFMLKPTRYERHLSALQDFRPPLVQMSEFRISTT